MTYTNKENFVDSKEEYRVHTVHITLQSTLTLLTADYEMEGLHTNILSKHGISPTRATLGLSDGILNNFIILHT